MTTSPTKKYWLSANNTTKNNPHRIHTKQKAAELNQSPFLLPFVEMEGIEPSSKRGTNKLSTCLVLTWFSSIGRIKTTNLKLIL